MTALRLQAAPAAERAALKAIADFQSDTAELLAEEPPRAARVMLHILAAMVLVFLALSILLPVERVVVARGRITSQAQKIVVQPLETSIVREIKVREGQVVQKGEVLALLDPTFSEADVATLRRRIDSLDAETRRIRAELAGEPFKASGSEASVLQARIYETRMAEYKSQIAGYDQKEASLEATRARAENELALYKQRLKLFGEVEHMRATLERQRAGTRLSTLSATDARVEIERNVAAQQGIMQGAQHDLETLRSQRGAFMQKWQSDNAEDLVVKERQLDQSREELAKADKRRDLVQMRAVDKAIVLQVADISAGAIVEAAKKMFVLVPIEGGVQAEAEILARDQGFVKPGQEVELKLDAWPYSRHGTARGVVRTVSADSFSKESQGVAGPSVFIAHIDVSSVTLRGVPREFHLVPGMPLQADVAVGTHTLMGYMMERAMPIVTEGLREP